MALSRAVARCVRLYRQRRFAILPLRLRELTITERQQYYRAILEWNADLDAAKRRAEETIEWPTTE